MALPVKKRVTRHFNIKPLRVDNFMKVNDIPTVESPIIFTHSGEGIATNPLGLLSNEIFGITQSDRSSIFGRIKLGKSPFIAPLFYKVLVKLDGKIADVVHATKTFSIKNGELTPDPNGDTGLKWLYNNFDKIKFKSTGALSREYYMKYIHQFKDRMWIKDFVVIPPFYRDVNSADEANRGIGVGDINKLYTQLIVATKSLEESAEYGITMSDTVAARIEDILVSIYDWFVGEFTGKLGIVNRTAISKSTDMSARVVISAPNLKVETIDDLMVDLDHVAAPMAALLANFFPYVMFWLRNFFQTELSEGRMEILRKDGSVQTCKLKDPQVAFSDTVLKEEIDRFIHGHATRLRRIEVPVEPFRNSEGKTQKTVTMRFKGFECTAEEFAKGDVDKFPIQERDLTWCDIFFIALCDVTADKMVLITRYPIDSCFNQFPSKVNVRSTKRTEGMVVNGKFYRWYPYIREDLIDTNTTNLFMDTLSLSNVYLKSIDGDYDGDQISIKSIYSVEANKELEEQLNSKRRYISVSGKNIMVTTNEGVDAMYALTMVLPNDSKRMTRPRF